MPESVNTTTAWPDDDRFVRPEQRQLVWENVRRVKFSLPCLLIWLIYLLAYYPALMSADSINQWGQVAAGHFDNSHPAFHTFLNWLVTRFWYSPAAIALAQIVALSVVFGLVLQQLARMGTPVIIQIGIILWAIVPPVNGMTVITLWKDIAYAIALLGLFGLILKIIDSQGKWLYSAGHLLLLTLVMASVGLLRHNGLPAVLLTGLAGLLLLSSRSRLLFASCALVSLLFCYSLTRWVYPELGVVPASSSMATGTPIYHLAAVVKHHEESLTDKERSFLESMLPIPAWKAAYNPYTVDPLAWGSGINFKFAEEHQAELFALWQKKVTEHPRTILKHYLSVSSMVWSIPAYQDAYFYACHGGIDANNFELTTQPFLPRLNGWLNRLVYRTTRNDVAWLVWRPAFYLYLTILAAVIAAIRFRRRAFLLAAAPSLANSAVMMLLIPAQQFRYQYPVYLIGLAAVGLLFLKPTPKEPEPSPVIPADIPLA